MLKKPRVLLSGLLARYILQRKILVLPLILGVYAGIMKGVTCGLMRQFGERGQEKQAFVAGLIAGLVSGMCFDRSADLKNLRLLACMRALDGVFTKMVSEICWNNKDEGEIYSPFYPIQLKREWCKDRGMFYTMVFAVCSSLLSYSYIHEPRIASSDVINTYSSFSFLDNYEKVSLYVFIERAAKTLPNT